MRKVTWPPLIDTEAMMKEQDLPGVTIYTDGACDPNPGPGGWAAILLHLPTQPHELCGAEATTTNNRMELQAALEGLRALSRPHRVLLRTDSQYVVQGASTRLLRSAEGEGLFGDDTVRNSDLWRELAREAGRHEVRWEWVRGHAGDPWNERVDALARSMLPAPPLPLDDPAAVHLFTGASCRAAGTGPGGWSVILRYGQRTKALTGQETETTANRMHLQSVIDGLRALKKAVPVHVYTTSEYLRDGITRWVPGWQRRNWRTGDGKPVRHRDLWEALLQAAAGFPVTFHLVREEALPAEMVQAQQLARGVVVPKVRAS